MLATTIAFYVVGTHVFKWKKRAVLPAIGLFFVVDLLFVASGLPKFIDGAWVPLAISAVIATISLTWLHGRRSLARALAMDQEPVAEYSTQRKPVPNPTGRSVLLTSDPSGIPFVRRHLWMPAFLEDKIVILLNVLPASRPYVEQVRRVAIEQLGPALFLVKASFGYMETPQLTYILRACDKLDFNMNDEHTTFFYAVPAIVGLEKGGMHRGGRALFSWLSRASRSLVDDLEPPPDRRVGLGVEVRM